MSKLSGKKILLTGADGALGTATLHYLCAQGCEMVATAFSAAGVARLKQESFKGKPTILACDLADEKQVAILVEDAIAQLCKIDALVNVAGGFVWTKLADCTVDQFNFLIDANVKSNWLLTKFVAPHMAQNKYGRIVFISAGATKNDAAAGMGPYVGSKRFLNAIVEAAAAEFGNQGIKVNSIAPTIIDTPRNREDMPDADFSKWEKPSAIAEKIGELIK